MLAARSAATEPLEDVIGGGDFRGRRVTGDTRDFIHRGPADLLRIGDQYLLLDYDATLALVALDEKGMRVVTKSSIGESRTWTPPTLVGTALFVRDEERIRVLDLSPGKTP